MRRLTLLLGLGALACSETGPERVGGEPEVAAAPVAAGARRAPRRAAPNHPHNPSWFKRGAPLEPGEAIIPSFEMQVEIGEGTAVDLLPEAEVPARPRRRMNLDQLASAMVQASGGFAWTERRGSRDVDLFTELSATLGKPDYIQITTEDLEPSALFQKFLDDAARSVCGKMLDHDLNRAGSANNRVLMRFVEPHMTRRDNPQLIDMNLRFLLERIHSRRVALDGPALSGWRWQFDGLLHSGASGPEAWNAICVTLFTHPDFYSY